MPKSTAHISSIEDVQANVVHKQYKHRSLRCSTHQKSCHRSARQFFLHSTTLTMYPHNLHALPLTSHWLPEHLYNYASKTLHVFIILTSYSMKTECYPRSWSGTNTLYQIWEHIMYTWTHLPHHLFQFILPCVVLHTSTSQSTRVDWILFHVFKTRQWYVQNSATPSNQT